MRVSMGRKATDNAFGERVNGIIKNEYLIPWALGSFRELKKRTKQAVSDYNTKRHHGALGRCAPLDYEQACQQLPEREQTVEIIRSENTPKHLEARLNQKILTLPANIPIVCYL